MDESQKLYIKWERLDTKGSILFDSISMDILDKGETLSVVAEGRGG